MSIIDLTFCLFKRFPTMESFFLSVEAMTDFLLKEKISCKKAYIIWLISRGMLKQKLPESSLPVEEFFNNYQVIKNIMSKEDQSLKKLDLKLSFMLGRETTKWIKFDENDSFLILPKKYLALFALMNKRYYKDFVYFIAFNMISEYDLTVFSAKKDKIF